VDSLLVAEFGVRVAILYVGWQRPRSILYCTEVPGANSQGRTKEEAKESLAEAIALIFEDRRADGLRAVPPEALKETVVVG
jgi:predicted RNase H-like HicB family nuclease